MFSLGLVAALFFILFLGLTVLRLLKKCPSPNAAILSELMNVLDRPDSRGPVPPKTAPFPAKTKHAA